MKLLKQLLLVILCILPIGVYAKDIDTQESYKLIQNNSNIKIIDVRTPQEFQSGYIKGAININISDNNFISQIQNLDKKQTYLIYCRSGARSKKAEQILNSYGISNTYNMTGGIINWSQNKLPIITE